MCIRNRLYALIFRIIFLIGCGTGLYLNSGIPGGKPAPYMLIFYTIQSNALCFLFFLILAFKNIAELKSKGIRGTTKLSPHLKGAVTMTIAVTGLVYHFVLAPMFLSSSANYHLFSWQNILVHYFVPIAVILDWLIFDEKWNFRWFDPLLWILIPVAYFLFIIIRAKTGGVIEIVKSHYPYFFIDVDLLGWINVLKNAGLLVLGFLLLGYIIYWIDRIAYVLHSQKPLPFKNVTEP